MKTKTLTYKSDLILTGHSAWMKGGCIRMKLYQGILAWLSYFLVQIVVFFYISKPYYTTITGIILLIAYAFLMHKKQMLHTSSRDLKGSQLLSCFGIGLGIALFFKFRFYLIF